MSPTRRTPTRVGIIGCGGMARLHQAGYAASGVEVAVVAEPDEERGRAFADAAGAEWVSSHRDLLDRVDDTGMVGVSVTVPNHLHRKVCIDILRRGVPILCEKTLAASIKDAKAIADEVAATGTTFQIGYMKRFHPTVQTFFKMVRRIGDIEGGHLACHQPMRKWPMDAWFFTPDQGGGGILLHGGSHTLDLLLAAVPLPPTDVVAAVRIHPEATVEHHAAGAITFDGGVHVSFEAGWLPHTASGPLGTGWDESITLRGTKGIARLQLVDWTRSAELRPTASLYLEKTGAWEHVSPEPVDWFAAEMKAFVKTATRRAPGQPSVVDGYNVDAVVHSAYRAARTGRRQRIPLLGT